MKAFLEQEGFEVESYENAQEANLAIGGGIADMVIMGLAFADSEGEEFLSRTVESFSGPVIVVSASIDEERAQRLISLGAKMALSKSGSWKNDLRSQLWVL